VPTKRSTAIDSAKGKIGDDSGARSGMTPEPRPHKYDDPKLNPKGFLLAVMRDPTVALEHRIDAAAKVMPLLDAFDFPDLRDSGLTYRIPVLLQ
jgi:hypothetical protein